MGVLLAVKGAWWIFKFILRRREEFLKSRKRGIVVVVTGGTSGLGLAIVQAVCMRLAKIETQGKHTVIMTSRSCEKGLLALEVVRHPTVRVGFHQLDLIEEDSIRVFSEGVKERFGEIDILINNAGVAPETTSLATKGEARKVLDVNFYGTKAAVTALMPLMANGGRVVTVASGLAELAIRWMSGETYKKLFSLASTEKDVEAVVKRFAEELEGAAAGSDQLHAALAYPSRVLTVRLALHSFHLALHQAARIALTQSLGSKANETSSNPPRLLTFCAFSPGWCRTPSGGSRAPFSALDGAEEALFATFDAKDDDVQGSFIIGRKPARFGCRLSCANSQPKESFAAVDARKLSPEKILPAIPS
ncbi:hypothetical protein Esti_005725 [Eimeria stiedai]